MRLPWPRGVRGWIDLAIELVLASLILFAPLAFGSVEPWSEAIVIYAAATIGVLLSVRILCCRGERLPRTAAFVPILLFLLVVVLQLMPLPQALLSHVSPATTELRTQLLGDNGGGESATLSLYPGATRHDLRMLFALTLVFTSVVTVFRSRARIKRLLVAVVCICSGIAVLALVQDLTGATNVYWVGPPGNAGATAGPFVHYGHYAEFANLGIGACVALILVLWRESSIGNRRKRGRRVPSQGPDSRAIAMFLVALSAIVMAATVALSTSRAGTVAMVGAGLFGAVLLARSRGLGGGAWTGLPIVAIFLGLGLSLGTEPILDRLGTLSSSMSYADRLQILKDLRACWARFPIFGTGLGSHETTYPMFDTGRRADLATHAENEYAEVMEETGGVGLLLVIGFLVIVLANGLRAARRGKPPIRLAAVGLTAGLVAVLIHCLADFGPHLPGDSVLIAVVCGLLINLGRFAGRGHQHSAAAPVPPTQAVTLTPAWRLLLPRFVTASVILFAVIWSAFGAARSAEAAAYATQALNLREVLARTVDETETVNQDYVRLITSAEAACSADPLNVKYRLLLAESRWQSISRVRDPQSGEVILTEQSHAATGMIVTDIHSAIRLCPTFGPLHSLAGRLRMKVLADGGGETDVHRAYLLSPCDASAIELSAMLDATAGRWDDVERKLQRYFFLSQQFFPVAKICVQGGRSDVAERLAGNDPGALNALAATLDLQIPPDTARTAALRERAFQRLSEVVVAPGTPTDTLVDFAQQCTRRNDLLPAIDAYRRVIARDFTRADWHLSLARLLNTAGKPEEAQREAKACLVANPGNADAQKLVDELDRAAKPGITTQP